MLTLLRCSAREGQGGGVPPGLTLAQPCVRDGGRMSPPGERLPSQRDGEQKEVRDAQKGASEAADTSRIANGEKQNALNMIRSGAR